MICKGISETGVEDEPLPPGTEKATNSKTASSANGETEGKEKTAKKESKYPHNLLRYREEESWSALSVSSVICSDYL